MAKDEWFVDGAHDDSHVKGKDYDWALTDRSPDDPKSAATPRTRTDPGLGGAARRNYAGRIASEAEIALGEYAADPENLQRMRDIQEGSAGRRAENRAQPQQELDAPGTGVGEYVNEYQHLKDLENYGK